MTKSFSFLLTVFGLQSCKTPPDPILPENLKSYATLNSNYTDANFEVILLSENKNYGIPNPLKLFYSVNGQVILEESIDEEPDPRGYRYLKLDQHANVVDSIFVQLTGTGTTTFVENFMVYTKIHEDSYYTTWPLDGDRSPKRIEPHNKELNWSDAELTTKQSHALAKADYYFYDLNTTELPDQSYQKIQRLFYCIEGRWNVLYNLVAPNYHLDERDQTYRYRRNFFLSSNDERPNTVRHFTLRHFQQKEKIKYIHSIGGGSSSFTSKDWVGIGYFDIPLLGDTLHIKKDGLIVEQAKPSDPIARYYLSNGKGQAVSPFHLNIFTDPKLNFAIYSTNAYTVYAIRKKQINNQPNGNNQQFK